MCGLFQGLGLPFFSALPADISCVRHSQAICNCRRLDGTAAAAGATKLPGINAGACQVLGLLGLFDSILPQVQSSRKPLGRSFQDYKPFKEESSYVRS